MLIQLVRLQRGGIKLLESLQVAHGLLSYTLALTIIMSTFRLKG
jgi:hypothetical protein